MVFTLSSREVCAQLNAFSLREAASPSNIRKPSIARIGSTKSSVSKLTDLIATSGRSGSRHAAAVRCRSTTTESAPKAAEWISKADGNSDAPLQLTYLEGNSWFWQVAGVTVLIDPIMEGPLDFSIPWLYEAYKNVTREWEVKSLPPLDLLLITQSLDDHCHLSTLRRLTAHQPGLRVIATPNAEAKMDGLFQNITYLEPGCATEVTGANGGVLKVVATKGPVLGPPWQRPESGYIVSSTTPNLSVYLEPHCVYDNPPSLTAHVVVTPVVRQLLPAFTLVSGQEDAVALAKQLKAKYVVPMANSELDAKGLLSLLVKPQGTLASFEALLHKECPDTKLLVPTPGEPLVIPISWV